MPFVPTLGLFFPQVSPVGSTTDLSLQPTTLVTPAASEVMFIVQGIQWWLYTLTAGAHVADSTHVLPADYDATLNAKTWVLTNSGYIGKVLIDQAGNPLVDQAGTVLSFG